MMEIELTNTQKPIDFSLDGIEAIAQNVRTILNTPKGSVPLDRDFGIDWRMVDSPSTRFMQKLKAEVVKQIEKYEPRVKVTRVSVLSITPDGQCIVSVRLKITV